MERKIARHQTRLSAAHEAALDQGFHVGQRVRTIDGLIGRIIEIGESFSPGANQYQIILDSGQGGGTFLASQLRPIPDDYGGGHQAPAYLPAGVTAALDVEADLEHTADQDYPEMGDVLRDRPDPGRQFTVIGSRHTAVPLPHSQLKLFHQEHEPRPETCPECGYPRHDPDHNFLHLRHVHQQRGDYEPDECEHCGGDMNARDEHEEQHSQWLGSQDWYTDWSHEGPGDTLHRGIGLDMPSELHHHVHDESRPVPERAHALLSHVLKDQAQGSYHGGLGNYWSDDADVSKEYAESATRRYSRHEDQTPVMLHVHTPSMEHIETDPDELQSMGVYSFHLAGNREVPIQNQAPLRIKGISWARPGHGRLSGAIRGQDTPPHLEDDPAWTHHEFGGEGIRAHAASYADGVDPREQDYNGEPPVGGVYWGAPAQQAFVDEELGQPEDPMAMEPGGPEEEEGPPPLGATAQLGDGPHQLTPREERGDRWHAYQGRFMPDTLHRGIHVQLPPDLEDHVHDEGVPREDRAHALAQHFAGGGLGMHWTPHVNIAHRSLGNAADEPGNVEDEDEGYDDDAYGEHPAAGTDVMFHVKRPGQKRIIRDPAVLEEHQIGWAHSQDEDEVPVKPGSPLRLQAISWKPHEPDYPLEPYEHHDFAKTIRHTAGSFYVNPQVVHTARVPWTDEQREQLHSWQQAPTAGEGDFVDSRSFTNKVPQSAPGPDPEMQFAEAVGPRAYAEHVARLAAHDPHDPKADEVYAQLAKKFPPEATSWVHDAKWEGPHRVPLDQIDFTNRDSWAASSNPKKVKKARKKILKKEKKGKDPKAAILVDRPGKDTQMVADGHHRALAEEQLAQDDGSREGLHAWTAHVDDVEGPWDTMHSSQHEEGELPLDDGQEAPPPEGTGDELAPGPGGTGQEPAGPGGDDTAPFEPGDPGIEPGAEPGMNPPPVTTGLPPLSQGGTPGPRTRNVAPVQPVTPVKPAKPGKPDDKPGKDEALDSFEKAASSASFRFEFTASWADVKAKAERIHREGGVRITALAGSLTVGEVKGDHATYEAGLQYYPGRGFSVMAYSCGCPWASFHQDPDYPGRFAGRMCSHALALSIEARQRGTVRKTMFPELGGWPEEVVTKSWPPWHPSDKSWAQEWKAPMTRRPIMGARIAGTGDIPALTAARVLADAGEDPAAVAALLSCAGLVVQADQANAPWGSQNVIDDPPPKPYGATSPPEKDRDPGSYGPLSGPDPSNWGEIQDNSAIQMPITSDAALRYKLEDTRPGEARMGGARHGQAGKQSHARIIDTGSPGRVTTNQTGGPGRNGTVRQAAGSALDTARMDTKAEPATMPEWQESFGYADRAATAGSSTAITPRDPAGLRFEEAQAAARRAFTASMNATALPRQPVPEVSREDARRWVACPSCGYRGPGNIQRTQALSCPRCSAMVSSAGPYEHMHSVISSAAEPQLDGALAELKDEPEAALDPEGLTADSAENPQNPWGNPRQATYEDAKAYDLARAVPDYSSTSTTDSGRAQHPSQVTQQPGMGSADDPYSPDDPSIQTIGQAQFGGGDVDSGDLSVYTQGQENPVEGENADIVSQFQRSAAAAQYTGDGAVQLGNSDIAAAARAFLSKTADCLPAEEAAELIREGRGTRARNLDLLDLEGTHYTDDPGLDDREDDVLYA